MFPPPALRAASPCGEGNVASVSPPEGRATSPYGEGNVASVSPPEGGSTAEGGEGGEEHYSGGRPCLRMKATQLSIVLTASGYSLAIFSLVKRRMANPCDSK